MMLVKEILGSNFEDHSIDEYEDILFNKKLRYLGYNSLAKGYNEVRDLSYDDQIEIDLWALWIGVRRLGIVCKRTWGSYHKHLIKTVKLQMDILNKKLQLLKKEYQYTNASLNMYGNA